MSVRSLRTVFFPLVLFVRTLSLDDLRRVIMRCQYLIRYFHCRANLVLS